MDVTGICLESLCWQVCDLGKGFRGWRGVSGDNRMHRGGEGRVSTSLGWYRALRDWGCVRSIFLEVVEWCMEVSESILRTVSVTHSNGVEWLDSGKVQESSCSLYQYFFDWRIHSSLPTHPKHIRIAHSWIKLNSCNLTFPYLVIHGIYLPIHDTYFTFPFSSTPHKASNVRLQANQQDGLQTWRQDASREYQAIY